jgi:hypothetical protein
LEVLVSSSQPAIDTAEQQEKGRHGKKAGERGNIVFGKGTKCIVKNMTNKSVREKKSFIYNVNEIEIVFFINKKN